MEDQNPVFVRVDAVTLSSPSGAEFEGFLIRVQRTAGDTEECVGAFVDNGPKIKELKYHHASPTAVV